MYVSLGMAVIVPLGLLAALAMLALNGGIPGLGSLRQAVSGPSATAVAPPRLGGPITATRNPALRSPAASSTGVVGSGAALPTTVPTGGGRTGGALLGAGGGRGSAPAGSNGGSRSGSGGSGSGGYPQTSRPSGRQPSGPPTVVDRVVRTVTPITSGLPAPVGTVVTQTLKSGGAVADRVLHHLPGQ